MAQNQLDTETPLDTESQGAKVTTPPKPALKDQTGHAYPNGHLWLYCTVILFLLALPALVIFNVITQGSELVPSLQPTFHPNNTNLEQWWGTRHLPERLRPSLPQCQPHDLGRGDTFRVSASLFDYTVMSTWNTSHTNVTNKVQEQERVEYHGESFANCVVNAARFDYSLGDRTVSVMVGTTMVFSWETTKDFIGQYYGPGLDLLDLTKTTNYRQTVLAVLDVISTDALSIFSIPHLPVAPLSMRAYFNGLNNTEATLPDPTTTSSITYVNGTQPRDVPREGLIYTNTIYNLVYVAMDAVNLDLGNTKSPNMFRNFTRFNETVYRNQAPPGINSTDWADLDYSQSIYYGRITPPYQTWADMLRNKQPSNITIGDPTGLPKESVMVTSYLCPIYQIKPLKSLLSSVFIGSAAMTSSAWGGWMLLVALIAKGQMEPRAKCTCDECKEEEKKKKEKEMEKEKKKQARAVRRAARVERVRGFLSFWRARNTSNSGDIEQPPPFPYRPASDQSEASAKKE
ncbi:putative transmembrane protein [Rhizoctonia solani 123E]|uniref:Putative transmembrane protein n=1 Tax=Rhizoctonia solani 123E TaxID=1423351 RepID=A0A074RL68_9AGAM|nr:putative transmembrane protein [Rhizoctonia solani 123E]